MPWINNKLINLSENITVRLDTLKCRKSSERNRKTSHLIRAKSLALRCVLVSRVLYAENRTEQNRKAVLHRNETANFGPALRIRNAFAHISHRSADVGMMLASISMLPHHHMYHSPTTILQSTPSTPAIPRPIRKLESNLKTLFFNVATPIFIHSSTTFPRQSSFVPLAPHHVRLFKFTRYPRRNTLNTTLTMRKPRNPPSPQSPVTQNNLKIPFENLAHAWRNASSPQRFIISATTIASVALVAGMLNALFHVSLFLAFSAVPLLLIPLVFAFLASFTAFTFLTLATAAVAALFVGTPLFAVSLFAKAFLPTALLTGGIALVLRPLMRFNNVEHVEQPPESVQDVDDLERFDRILRNRQTPKSIDVDLWNINDVLDELDYVGLGAYRQLFIEERIDGPALLDLTYNQIRAEFAESMPLGDRMRLTRLVAVLRKQSKRLQ